MADSVSVSDLVLQTIFDAEIRAVREVNAHLPFAEPIEQCPTLELTPIPVTELDLGLDGEWHERLRSYYSPNVN